MELSIAAGLEPTGGRGATGPRRSSARPTLLAGLVLAGTALLVYAVSNPDRSSPYDHYVRQAEAFLAGRAAIELPDRSSPEAPANGYFQDALPLRDATGAATGFALIPFPPLPALLLVPFVALLGGAANGQWLATFVGAFAVGLAWRMLGALGVSPRTRILATVFLGFGSALWYAASLGTTWFLAHVVAVALALLAIDTALRVDGRDGGTDGDAGWSPGDRRLLDRRLLDGRLLDGRLVLAGLFLGLAATARLPVLLGAPLLLAGGGHPIRRALSVGAGMTLPVVALLGYNLVTSGSPVHPAYEWQYRREIAGYPQFGYRADWSIEDPRYIPGNLVAMLTTPPEILPPCEPGTERGILSADCPLVAPSPVGMSLLLASPAWLLGLAALRLRASARLVVGAAVAVGAIALVDLAHFSQGWVQFGYRFSNDFAPFALVLVALGIERIAAAWGRAGVALSTALVAASAAIGAWGLTWAIGHGW